MVLGGGQDASAVTTTDHRAGKFEAKFFDKVTYSIALIFIFCSVLIELLRSPCCLVSSVLEVLPISYV